jgi:hypothetical protein
MSREKMPRLVDDPAASPAARALLRAARDPGPTPAQQAALWGAIETSLPGPGGGGGEGGDAPPGGGDPPPAPPPPAGPVLAGAASATAATVTVGSSATTWLGVAAIAGLSLGAAVLVGRGAAPTPQEPQRTVTTAIAETRPADRTQETGDRTPEREPEPETGDRNPETGDRNPEAGDRNPEAGDRNPEAGDRNPEAGDRNPEAGHRTAVPSASAPDTSPPPRSVVEEEAAVTREARELLRAGDAPRALALLEQARVRFSGGVLVQERAALTIEALARSGQADRAAGLARAFLEAWPQSAHADRVRPWAR